MAQLGQATRADIDRLLDRTFLAWEELATVEQEIDDWDLIEQIVYLEEWPLEEERLLRLARHVQVGDLNAEQCVRYRALLKLVEERRPIIERLLRS